MTASSREDAPLETLFLPFATGRLSWPGATAFLRARAGAALQEQAISKLVCEQTFKPDADALLRAGHTVVDGELQDSFALVLVLPPRQREEARALLARAVTMARGGGRVVACASNNEGARSLEDDLSRLIGPLETITKNKCRVFWSAPLDGDVDSKLLTEWRALDAVRPIVGGRFVSRPGVFAWDRIDLASALLAEHLPSELAGAAADLGAGFGYLAVEMLSRCPAIRSLDLYEAERRALDLARENVRKVATGQRVHFSWHDVTAGLDRTYDVIVTNPPFHAGTRADRPDIGRRFIQVAAAALNPGGRLWLVANRHLAYEGVLNASFGSVRIVAQQHGFKIIEAVRA